MPNRKGFTFMEVALVIAILGVVAAVLMPVFARERDTANLADSLVRAKQLGQALKMYAEHSDGKCLPSTNYGYPESDPRRMWQVNLKTLVKNPSMFIAPGSEGRFVDRWDDRGQMSFGYNSATALDVDQGCNEDLKDTADCVAFATVVGKEQIDSSDAPMLALTPNGPTSKGYRGYEFSPYNGPKNSDRPYLSGPLIADVDLVAQNPNSAPDTLKPVYCRYLSSGHNDGQTPIVFGDAHAKTYSADKLLNGKASIHWRIR